MENTILENGRPDKPVTCPRCQSLNTKFCYFNNYNVKQPRHFCRECQRYWTAGGSLRNVPVGAGRRKHKSSQANPAKSTGNGNVFCISGSDLDQGLFIQPIDSSSVLPLKQNVACSPSRKKLPEAQRFTAMKNPAHADATVMKGSEELGFSGMGQKPARELALELKLSKEIHATEEKVYTEKLPPSHVSATHELPPSRHITKYCLPPSQHIAENDESTCCSSVTATVVSSSSEAVSELHAASTRTPMLSSMAKSLGFENPAASWGPLMWPWLWPFSFNAGNAMPRVDPDFAAALGTVAAGGMPQVDPAFAAAMGAVAAGGMPQVDPAFAAAIGAVAIGNMPRAEPAFAAAIGAVAAGSMPQVDPAFTAAVAASFLQWLHAWNPYAWGLPWNVAWNMPGETSNVSNALSKRPRSPAQGEQGSLCVPKTLRMDGADEAAHSTILSTLNVSSLPCSAGSSGFCSAFQPKADVFQPKPMVQQAPEEQSDFQQHQSPHTNPAAQARSVTFQEGN